MLTIIRRNSLVQIVAVLGLVLSLGGTAYALTVTGRDIKNETVTGRDIRDGSLRQSELAFDIAEAHMIGGTDTIGDMIVAPNDTFVGVATVTGETPWNETNGIVQVTISYRVGSENPGGPAAITARALLNGTAVTPDYSESVDSGELGVLSFQTFVDLQPIAGNAPTLRVEVKAEGSGALLHSISAQLIGFSS